MMFLLEGIIFITMAVQGCVYDENSHTTIIAGILMLLLWNYRSGNGKYE